jgi:hypothetical protein
MCDHHILLFNYDGMYCVIINYYYFFLKEVEFIYSDRRAL